MRIKRLGVSPIITILLVILVAVAAALAYYGFVLNWISNTSENVNIPNPLFTYDNAYGIRHLSTFRIWVRNIAELDVVLDSAYLEVSGEEVYPAKLGQLFTVSILYDNYNGEDVYSVEIMESRNIIPGGVTLQVTVNYSSDNDGVDTIIYINILFGMDGPLSGTLISSAVVLNDGLGGGSINTAVSGALTGYAEGGYISRQAIQIDVFTKSGDGYISYEKVLVPSSEKVAIDVYCDGLNMALYGSYTVKLVAEDGSPLYIPIEKIVT
jgi:hypothetical protein